MAQGAFNVTALIRELGLQAVEPDVMEVLRRIQPVITVGDLSDVTPPHVAPTAIFGSLSLSAAGTNGTVALQCLAPGGGFIEWVTIQSTTANALMSVRTVDPGVVTVVGPAGQVSRDPVVSIVRQDAIAALGAPNILLSQTENFFGFSPRPLFIPRASFFILQASNAGVGPSFSWGFSFREVPASEHVPG